MYDFTRINHGLILRYTVLVSLTPLIPIPFLDDWIKAGFMRRMVRGIAAGRGLQPHPAVVEALIQDDFWSSCAESCLYVVLRLLREIAAKIFFWIEWRRAFNLLSATYYTGFLLDAALLDGYDLHPPGAPDAGAGTASAARLREAIRRARYGANPRLIQRAFRQSIRPLAFLKAGWSLARQALGALPGLLLSLPGAAWRTLRGAPGQIRDTIAMRVQVLLGKQKAPELEAVERMVQAVQARLLAMDSGHFDELRDRLWQELKADAQPGAPPREA